MEKLSFFEKLADKYSKLTDRQKISYLTFIIIIILSAIIIYYERKVTRIENEHAIMVNNLNNRNDIRLAAAEERVRLCNENFLKYLENNEKEIREILFKYEEYRKKVKE